MNKIACLLALIICFFYPTFACMNEEEGGYLQMNDFFENDRNAPYGHIIDSEERLKKGIKDLDSLYKATGSLEYLSDKGFLLVLLKQYNEAIQLYLDIEKKEPNRYSTASNLGTAYELTGQNEKALKWIKKSVEIDSESHSGSEWLHVKILEAKIKGSNYVTSKFLINTDFGADSIPVSNLTEDELLDIWAAIDFQLNERVSFVKPKESIVAQLFFDLGNVSFLLGKRYIDEAVTAYTLAKEYGFNRKIIDKRMELSRLHTQRERVIEAQNSAVRAQRKAARKAEQAAILAEQETSENYTRYTLIAAVVLVSLVILLFAILIIRNNKRV